MENVTYNEKPAKAYLRGINQRSRVLEILHFRNSANFEALQVLPRVPDTQLSNALRQQEDMISHCTDRVECLLTHRTGSVE